ncbi:SRPBCC family protein [Halorubrum sp. AD140]|uniref:SRPBCC family protein n=1 Tax=Halorubrum sp. AD140 TaxID=3050073 RepID=UPI002ACD049B|nr:SRPBCC family protein [Halorubrum sp. AD140]MDZ5812740.1 SRPBCC family protein [Halorubrum sp. AD140]
MILEATTEVEAPPEAVYRFFEEMEEHYERWHPDHVSFRWTEGDGLRRGAEACFEEQIAGKLRRQTVRFVEVTPDRYLEFKPTSRLVALLMPHVSFAIDARADGCVVTQRIKVRTGPIGARLNAREFDAVRTHMREEGENLKRLLERERDGP